MYKNCTPHAIRVLNPAWCEYDARTRSYRLKAGGSLVDPVMEIQPAGVCPRCATHEVELEPVEGIPAFRVEYGEIENLPEPQPFVYLIVSAIVANAGRLQGRTDLAIPHRVVRDADGNIVGCLGLAWA